MATFFDDLAGFLDRAGYTPVHPEYLPEMPDELVAFFVYGTLPAPDGSLTRFVQIQCRSSSPSTAYENAFAISKLLDSGSSETLIYLSAERFAICRPLGRPKSFGQDAKKRFTYYAEVSIWGPDSK